MHNAGYAHYLKLQSSSTQLDLSTRLRATAETKAADFPDSRLGMIPEEIDVVFSGGGFRNCYSGGVCLGLEYLRRRHGRPKVIRYAGTSAGAHMCYIALNDRYDDALSWACAVVDTLQAFPYMRPWPMWTHFFSKLSAENDLPEPGRLHVSVTKVSWWPVPRLENQIVSSFSDADDVAAALLASGAIPLLLCPGVVRRFRNGSYIDGAVTNNTPVFTDGVRPQLVVRFGGLPRSVRTKLVYFSWKQIMWLINMGMNDALTLFSGQFDRAEDQARSAENLSLLRVGEHEPEMPPARATLR